MVITFCLCTHEAGFCAHMPNNSKHVKDIFITSKSKIHMEQDDQIYYHAQSFQILSSFLFMETILIWMGSPCSFF